MLYKLEVWHNYECIHGEEGELFDIVMAAREYLDVGFNKNLWNKGTWGETISLDVINNNELEIRVYKSTR